MILDSINLETSYGLRLSTVTDHLSQPKRKSILKVQTYDFGDFTFEGGKITVRLFARYTNKTTMYNALTAINNLMTAFPIHTLTIAEHGLTDVAAVARNGASIEIVGRWAMMVTITFTRV